MSTCTCGASTLACGVLGKVPSSPEHAHSGLRPLTPNSVSSPTSGLCIRHRPALCHQHASRTKAGCCGSPHLFPLLGGHRAKLSAAPCPKWFPCAASGSLAVCDRRRGPVPTISVWSEVEVLTLLFGCRFGYIWMHNRFPSDI